MKLLMAHGTWYPTGGDWTYIQSLNNLYTKRGDQIVPFSMIDQRNAPTQFSKYFVSNVDYKRAHDTLSINDIKNVVTRAVYSSEAVRNLTRLLDENSIDIAQLNSIHNIQTLSIIPLLKARGIPIVWRVLDYKILCPNRTFLNNKAICTKCLNGNYFWSTATRCKKNSLSASLISTVEAYFNKFQKYYELVDCFLVQSDFSKRLFLEAGFPEHKVRVLANPFELTDSVIPPTGDSVSENYILYFGRLSPEKGVHTLIEAMKQINGITLYIIGDGPSASSLQEIASELSPSKIKFLGPMWGDDLNDIIKHAKLTVVPSEWYEVSPYAILQSFDFGKPVVGANIGGIPDLIKNGYNGKLFESGNSADLKHAIISILEDQGTDYFKNCREYLAKSHSPKAYYEKTRTLFQEMM